MKHTETREKQTGDGDILTAPKQPAEVPADAVEETQPDIIYNNNIDLYVDDFIMSNYPDKTQEDLKQDKSFFPLLINYIYNNYLGDLFKNKITYKLQGIRPRYDDIKMIDYIFNIYINLVYRYKFNNRPSITEFSILTGINRNTITSWLSGDVDNYILDNAKEDKRKYITSEYASAVQNWQAVCEQSLVDGSGVMEIFLLKAVHGMRDNNNDVTITVNHKAIVSADVLPDLIGLKDSKD